MSSEESKAIILIPLVAILAFGAFVSAMAYDVGRQVGREEGRTKQEEFDRQFPSEVMECDAARKVSEPCVFTPGVVGKRYCYGGRWDKCELEASWTPMNF